jgi:hypothetical protein
MFQEEVQYVRRISTLRQARDPLFLEERAGAQRLPPWGYACGDSAALGRCAAWALVLMEWTCLVTSGEVSLGDHKRARLVYRSPCNHE